MSYSSLTNTARTAIAKLLYDNLDFYIAFGSIPSTYIDAWDIDTPAPSYVAKKIQDEIVVRSSTGDIDYVLNKDIHTILEIKKDATSAQGTINTALTIKAKPGVSGNIQVVLTPGGFSGNEVLHFSNGVLSVLLENTVTTWQQLSNVLLTHSLIESTTIIANPTDHVTLGVLSDNVYLVGGADTVIYIQGTDFLVGTINNTDLLPLGSIKWISTAKPANGLNYKVSYWYKNLLSVETGLIQAFGFKKAVSKNYCLEDSNGSIRANDKTWSISNVPTNHLLFQFFIDNLDMAQGIVIRQLGLYSNTVPINTSNPNHFYSLTELQALGDLLIIENLVPYQHEIISSENISIVLTL